jgi:hypothetical protein
MSEIQRREGNERQALERQWQDAQRNIAVEQWQGMSLLQDSRFQPHAAQQTVDRLFPNYGDIFGHDMPHRLNLPRDFVIRKVKNFVKSVSSSKHWESESSSAFQHKEQAPNMVEDAVARPSFAPSERALPMIPTSEAMPAIAPQRRRYNAPRAGNFEAVSDFAGDQTSGDISHFPRRKLKF